MSASLRHATAADVNAIVDLIANAPGQLLPRDRAEVEQLLETFWVMEEDGEVVGCCCLEVYSPKIAEVRSLAVRESARKRGYGGRLVDAAVTEARARGIPQILVVTSNPEFFGRFNFGPCLNEKYALFWSESGTGVSSSGSNPDGRR